MPLNTVSMGEVNEPLNIMVYGDPGAGKTVLGASAPNTLVIAVEKGVTSAKQMGSTAEVFYVDKWAQLEEAVAYLKEHPQEYDWVTLDSGSELFELALQHQHLESKGQGKWDPLVPQLQTYMKQQNSFKNTVNEFLRLDTNFFMTALVERTEDEEAETIAIPLMKSKNMNISQYVTAKFPVVGYASARTDKQGKTSYGVRFVKKAPYVAKDRYNKLGVQVDTNLPKIVELIK